MIGDRIYRIDFAPLTENGYYNFSLAPSLLDSQRGDGGRGRIRRQYDGRVPGQRPDRAAADDPLVGLLYPNDASGRGEGWASHLMPQVLMALMRHDANH